MPAATPNELPTTVLKVSHHTPEHVAKRYPYAAFGSNLSLAQMAERCKDPDVIVAGTLPGHRLIFAHFCSIVKDDNSSVPIGIYSLNAADVDRLDKCEGLGRSYDRFLVTVLADDGRAVRCFTYIKRDNNLQPPSKHYYDKVLTGYRDWRFSDRRLRHARKAAQKFWDATKTEREARLSKNARNMWDDWYNGRGGYDYERQEQLPFGNVTSTGQVHVRNFKPKEQRTGKSLVTGRCRACGRQHDGECTSLPANINVPANVCVARDKVEWGAREEFLYWRIRGERAWYVDTSTESDWESGLVRGTLATRLPGSSAFIPKEDKQ